MQEIQEKYGKDGEVARFEIKERDLLKNWEKKVEGVYYKPKDSAEEEVVERMREEYPEIKIVGMFPG